MRGGHQRGLAHELRHGGVRALARRAARAVGHRHEARPQRLEPADRRPQRLLHLLRLGREEFEGDVDVAIADQPAAALLVLVDHRDPLQLLRCPASAAPRSRRPRRQPQRHGELVAAIPAAPAPDRAASAPRPQSASHCSTCGAGEPQPLVRVTARAGTPAHAGRNRRSADGRRARARAPPRARRAAGRSGSAAPDA